MPRSAKLKDIGVAAERHEVGGRLNNRAENSHQPFRRRERAMQRFRSLKTLQKFSSVHAQVHNQFNQERHLVTRQVYKQRRSIALVCKVRRRLRAGVSRYASANAVTPTTPPARSNAPSLCGRGSGPNNTLGACSWHSFPRKWTSDV